MHLLMLVFHQWGSEAQRWRGKVGLVWGGFEQTVKGGLLWSSVWRKRRDLFFFEANFIPLISLGSMIRRFLFIFFRCCFFVFFPLPNVFNYTASSLCLLDMSPIYNYDSEKLILETHFKPNKLTNVSVTKQSST